MPGAARITALLSVALFAAPAAAQFTRVTLLDGRQVYVRTAALNSFEPTDADKAVSRVVTTTGLRANFRVVPVDDGTVPNAAAAMDDAMTERYVLYNPRFLDAVNSSGRSGWAATGVLAHEIGHHLNGDALIRGQVSSDASYRRELAADNFAGAALARLGASIADAIAMTASLPREGSLTHPGRCERVAAVTSGWQSVRGSAPGFSPAGAYPECGGAVVANNAPPPPRPTTPSYPRPTVATLELDQPQAIRVGAEFSGDFRKRHWDNGLLITAMASGPGKATVVLSSSAGSKDIGQYNFYAFPDSARATITNYWNNKNYRLTALTATPDGSWTGVLTDRTGYTMQSYFVPNDSFPSGWIKAKWDSSYHVTSLARGGGKWAVVMSQNTGWGMQGWNTRVNFDSITAAIKQRWDDGYKITEIACGDGYFGIVATKGTPYYDQEWARRSTLPELQEYLQGAWAKGRRVLRVANCPDFYWVITTKGTPYY